MSTETGLMKSERVDMIPSAEVVQFLKGQAADLLKTGFLPKQLDTPEKVVTVALMGRELGIPMMQALRKIHVVNQTPTLGTELMLALAMRTGELEDFRVEDDGARCTVIVKRRGRTPVRTEFGDAEAQALGLAGKDNWKKQPATMRRWRAISANLRITFPDATGGMHSLEEIAPDIAVDDRGEPLADLPAALPPIAAPRKKAKPEALPAAPAAPPAPPAQVVAGQGMLDEIVAGIRAKGLTRGAVKTFLKVNFNCEDVTKLTPEQGSKMLDWLNEPPAAGAGA